MANAQPAEHAYDPADPHGFHSHDHGHGHVIVPWQILLGVLLALLFLTGLTVGQAQFEIYAAYEWGWEIPLWVNIVLAMFIATIKGTLVVLYFMQLRYDKGVNTVLFLFTVFAVWLFLMFTMIDLDGRNTITQWRGGEIVEGGSGVGIDREGFGGAALHVTVRENYIAEKGLTQDEFEKKAAAKHKHHAHVENSKDHSRVRTGLTPGLFDEGPWAEGTDEAGEDSEDYSVNE
ncbi:MAG: cytochrome C oxidase subunit IV family protein [Planctomycetota bacterium]